MQQEPTNARSSHRALCHAVLWHPLYKEQIRQFVSAADDTTLVAVTLNVIWYASGYGLAIAGLYGSLLLYWQGSIQPLFAIIVLLVLLVILVSSARGMDKVREELRKVIEKRREEPRETAPRQAGRI